MLHRCVSQLVSNVSAVLQWDCVRWPFVNETRWRCFGQRGLSESAAAFVKSGLKDGKQSGTEEGGCVGPNLRAPPPRTPQSCCLWPGGCHCGSRWLVLISHHHLGTVRNARPSLIKRCNGTQKMLRDAAPALCSWANQDVDTLGPIRRCRY